MSGDAGSGDLATLVAPPTPVRAMGHEPSLARYAWLLLGCAGLTTMLVWLDPRTLEGVPVWIKPTKFFVSIGVYAATLSWFFGLVRSERRRSWPMRFVVGAVLGAGSFELAYITIQAARGEASHYNVATPFHALMYQAMGVGAVLLVCAMPPLAWEIARRPAPGTRPDLRSAVVTGLLLSFVLGGGLAGYLSAQPGHAVGEVGGALPLLGWNRAGGDLRVAHFVGLHLLQALPLLVLLAAPLPLRGRFALLALGTVTGIAVTLAVFVQALRGQPFL